MRFECVKYAESEKKKKFFMISRKEEKNFGKKISHDHDDDANICGRNLNVKFVLD